MPTSLPAVRIPLNTWVDLYAATGIAVGTQISIQNTGSSEAILSESAVTPASSIGSNTIEKRKYLINKTGNIGSWAFSKTGTTLQVEEV
jgi:hypothetical protein